MLPYFMALGSIPIFIFMPMLPAIECRLEKKCMFYVFLTVAIVGMVFFISVLPILKKQR